MQQVWHARDRIGKQLTGTTPMQPLVEMVQQRAKITNWPNNTKEPVKQ